MISISLKKVLKQKGKDFLIDIELELKSGDFISIFGPSGSGKTSILRMLAGFMEPDEGYISVNGNIWFDSSKKVNIPVQKRKIGFVFQDYALFPNMTVGENIKYALGYNDDKRVNYLLEMVNMNDFRDRYPDNLSGGQKQRIAIIRAIARRPEVLMLDEPLSALDMEIRGKIQDELVALHKKMNLTTFIVTHDFREIFRTSNYCVNINNGKLSKKGHPLELFSAGKDFVSCETISVNYGEDIIFINNAVLKKENLIKGEDGTYLIKVIF